MYLYAFKINLELIMNGNSIHVSEAYMFKYPNTFICQASLSRKSHISSCPIYSLVQLCSLHDVNLEQYLLNFLNNATLGIDRFFLYPLLWKVLVYSSRITLFVDLVINSISWVYVYTFTTTFIIIFKSTLGV